MSLNNLGLAYRAKKVIIGTDVVLSLLKENKIYLVLLANDTSSNTIRKITNKTNESKTPINNTYTKEELSKALGKHNVSVVGIIDKGFSELLNKKGS